MFGELFGLSEDCVSWQSSSELTLFGRGKSRGGAESTLASVEVERTHLQLHSSCTANGHPGAAARLLVGHGGGNQLLFARLPKQSPYGNAICWESRNVLEQL